MSGFTKDGGRWLWKALDPLDAEADVRGLPDPTTNYVAMLNYQTMDAIPVPLGLNVAAQAGTLPLSTQSYDADLHLFQHPLLLGVSFSWPTATQPVEAAPMVFNFGATGGAATAPSISVNGSGSYFPRTSNIIYNTQIPIYGNSSQQLEGDNSNYLRSKGLEELAQRYRVIYGCAQIIPPHSTMFDSGTIQATQQIYSYRDVSSVCRTFGQEGYILAADLNGAGDAVLPATNDDTKRTYLFGPEDFPGPTDSIQNPKAMYGRYKTGAYMPYKLVNPLVFPTISTETRVVHTAPFHVVGAYFRRALGDPFIAMGWTGGSFVSSEPVISTNPVIEYALECVSYSGMRFFYHVQTTVVATAVPKLVQVDLRTRKYAQCYNGEVSMSSMNNVVLYSTSVLNGSRVHSQSAGAITSSDWNELTDMQNQNVCVMNFRSINLAAAINVQIRIGVEMMIVAGSAYSPFKHISPAHDAKALDAYCHIIRQVRDSYSGDVGSGENRSSFRAFLLNLLSTYEKGPISNIGARWTGPTGTF